jgi:hypothetical protein
MTGVLVSRVRKGAKRESWKVQVQEQGKKILVYVPCGFGSVGLEVGEDDFMLEGDKVIYKSLVKRKLKVRGGFYDQKIWTYNKQGYNRCFRLMRHALDKVWAGRGYKGHEMELDETVKERLIRCLLAHVGKRGFWLRKFDRKGKVINHTTMLVMVVRNYLIDIARYLERRNIPVSNSSLLTVLEKRDSKVRVTE